MLNKALPQNGNLDGVAEVVLLRSVEPVCTDPDCGLSAAAAHVGDCEQCGCGLFHADKECKAAHAAGWRP